MLRNFSSSPHPCGQPKDGKSASMVPAIFSSWDLDAQQGLFKVTTKFNAAQAMAEVMALASNMVNPIIINTLTCMWQVIHASQLLSNASILLHS